MESSNEGKPTAGKVCDGKDIDSVDKSSADNSNESFDKSTKDIILSLTDPTYKEVMHKYFKKLGPKTNPNPHITDAIAAQEVLDMFKSKEGKLLKLKIPRRVESGYVEVDDDEALDKICHDMNRRMESAKRWMDPKSSTSPLKKESPAKNETKKSTQSPLPSAPKPTLTGKKTNAPIVLSLTDPTYKEVMHKYFKKLGPKTNPNPHITDAIAAQEVLDMFKSKEGKLLKLKIPRRVESGYVEVDDDEALDKICHDMNRRMESAKRWMDPKSSTSPLKKESPAKSETKKSTQSPLHSAPKPTLTGKKTNAPIVLSLTDPTYKEVMHKYFKKLGPKNNQNSNLTDVIAAQEVLDMFKSKEGKLLKLKIPRRVESGYVEVDDDEALDKICRDMNRRMESAKRWMDPKSSTSPIKKESPAKSETKKSTQSSLHSAPKPTPTRKKTNAPIVLSLTDPTYKEVMHKYFKKMGAKVKKVDESKSTEADEAVKALNEFKNIAGKFLKLDNWRDPNSDYLEVDDDEALKKIKIDLLRRMESSKQWLVQKLKGSPSTKSKMSSSPTKSKKSSPIREASRKDSDDESHQVYSRALRKKDIVNYANNGAELGTGISAPVDSAPKNISPKRESKGVYVFDNIRSLYDLSHRPTKQRDSDVIISLRDSKYRDKLLPYFHELGTVHDKDKEKQAADELFEIFKAEGARFFKPNGRGKGADCVELDHSKALQNIYLDLRRRLDTTWWFDEDAKKSCNVSPPKKNSSNVKAKKIAQPTRHVIVSLSDPNYRSIMEEQFTRLGEKKGPDKNEATVAREVFNRFKSDGAVFYKRENFRDATSEPIRMDDEEAFKKIRTDIQRRMESASRWLDGGVNSKSYAETKVSPQKVSPVVGQTRDLHKKRERPLQSHRLSPPKKKKKIDRGYPGSEVSRYHEGARSTYEVATGSTRGSRRLAGPVITNRVHASDLENAPKVTICFGSHVIDTEAYQSRIQPAHSYARNFEFPDRFDPNVRPAVPTYSQQIYIPGNEVYARWLNDNDPSSYGTWYPGYVHSSKLAPTNVEGSNIPKLLYHVKFYDGAEGMDLHTEDMMMREQYEAWLHYLEVYYALPRLGNAVSSHISKGARVFAQWNDPTDPAAHGSWLQGIVRNTHDSRRYHVRFDNGDEDNDIGANHVVSDGVYVQLLAEKMKNSGSGVNRGSGVTISRGNGESGLNLITQASQVPSPMKRRLMDNNRSTAPNHKRKKPSALLITCEIATEDSTVFSNGSLLDELRCDEVLTSEHVARSNTQAIHYGIYVKTKPWRDIAQLVAPIDVDEPSKSKAERQDVSIEELRCQETLV